MRREIMRQLIRAYKLQSAKLGIILEKLLHPPQCLPGSQCYARPGIKRYGFQAEKIAASSRRIGGYCNHSSMNAPGECRNEIQPRWI
jgi:hypothetical protein